MGAISSVGRAPRLHRGCRQFEPVIAHHPLKPDKSAVFSGNNSKSDDLKWPLKEVHFRSGAIIKQLRHPPFGAVIKMIGAGRSTLSL